MGREQVCILYSLIIGGQGQHNSEVGQGRGLLEEGKLIEGQGYGNELKSTVVKGEKFIKNG